MNEDFVRDLVNVLERMSPGEVATFPVAAIVRESGSLGLEEFLDHIRAKLSGHWTVRPIRVPHRDVQFVRHV